MRPASEPGSGKRTAQPAADLDANKPSPLFACALAIAEARVDVDSAARLFDAIDAVVSERPCEDGGEPVFSASDASTIAGLANTIEERLSEVQGALGKQFDVLHGPANAEALPVAEQPAA